MFFRVLRLIHFKHNIILFLYWRVPFIYHFHVHLVAHRHDFPLVNFQHFFLHTCELYFQFFTIWCFGNWETKLDGGLNKLLCESLGNDPSHSLSDTFRGLVDNVDR